MARILKRPNRREFGLARRAPLLWAAGTVVLVYAGMVAATDGFDVGVAGVRLRSRTWQRPAVLALAVFAVAAIADRARTKAAAIRTLDVARLALSPRVVAMLTVAWTLVAGVVFCTSAAGGADSSGYLNQGRLLAHGRLLDEHRIQSRPPWPGLPAKLSPLGFRPTQEHDRLTPTYPPGYPMLLAPAFVTDERVAYLVVPVCGSLAVWLTFALGRRLGRPGAGATAALLLSVSPTFLYQLVQPMSDVPATAAWLLALYLATGPQLASAALAGAAAGLAILIRPNLAPLAGLIWIATALSPAPRPRRVAAAVLATVPAVAVLAVVQSVRFGSPWSSGYGRLDDLFAWSNVGPNLERYPRWMLENHTPAIALFLLAPVWMASLGREARRLVLILWCFAVAVILAYLPYMPFQSWEWSYTRFLLPAIPLMWLLTLIPLGQFLEKRPPGLQHLAAVPLIAGLVVFSIVTARSRFVFDLRQGEQRYTHAADYVRRALPANAIVFSMQHSGSLWFYTTRPIVRWDHIEPALLDEAIAWCEAHGYSPFMLIDREELDRMKTRFLPAGQRALDRAAALGTFGEATIYGFNRAVVRARERE